MRTAFMILTVVAAIAASAWLLMQENTKLWHLIVLGGMAGAVIGRIRWGWRGSTVGVVVECLLGLAAPILYVPFWLVFTLPPHPKVDL